MNPNHEVGLRKVFAKEVVRPAMQEIAESFSTVKGIRMSGPSWNRDALLLTLIPDLDNPVHFSVYPWMKVPDSEMYATFTLEFDKTDDVHAAKYAERRILSDDEDMFLLSDVEIKELFAVLFEDLRDHHPDPIVQGIAINQLLPYHE